MSDHVFRCHEYRLKNPFQFYVSRQKLTLKGERKALDDDALLKDIGVSDGDELFVKDLGAQISWRAVFVVEYVSFNRTRACWKTPL